MKTRCPDCLTINNIENMTMKMGGLLCTKCRRILFQPYVDPEYFEEFRRRKEEAEKNEKNGQEGT
jgi:hypothetical protein